MILEIDLSPQSISKAIRELKKFEKELPKKINGLIDKMVKMGEDCAINLLGHIDTGETLSSIVGYRDGNTGFIVAGGNAIWIEFGTGVTYNGVAGSSPHPVGEDLGMTIGTYGNGHGADEDGWYYQDDGGEWKHTYGIESNMFMYQTAQALKAAFPHLVKEIRFD